MCCELMTYFGEMYKPRPENCRVRAKGIIERRAMNRIRNHSENGYKWHSSQRTIRWQMKAPSGQELIVLSLGAEESGIWNQGRLQRGAATSKHYCLNWYQQGGFPQVFFTLTSFLGADMDSFSLGGQRQRNERFTENLTIIWWNGGGGIIKRLNVNMKLHLFSKNSPFLRKKEVKNIYET